jgi:hypothetical protein
VRGGLLGRIEIKQSPTFAQVHAQLRFEVPVRDNMCVAQHWIVAKTQGDQKPVSEKESSRFIVT